MTYTSRTRTSFLAICITVCGGIFAQAKHEPAGTTFWLYAGSFTGATPLNGHPDGHPLSKGIYVARFNAATGALTVPALAAQVDNPTMLAISPDQRFLYATTENAPESFVSAYAIDSHTGSLRLLNRLPTGGSSTAYLSLDRTGRNVLLANYSSASVTVLQTNSDGSLGNLTSFAQHAARGRQTDAATPHPHATVASPGNHYVVVPDLGLNKLFVYKFDAATGVLTVPATPVDLPPDSGPRHFTFSPEGNFAYLINQTMGDVDTFRWDEATGTLTPISRVRSFPEGLQASNMSAEIAVTPNGKFLYETNRRTHGPTHDLGPDSIVAYSINATTGTLTKVQDTDLGASIPRCFSIDPTGTNLVVAGEQTDRLTVYRINPANGTLTDAGTSVAMHAPACMQFSRLQ